VGRVRHGSSGVATSYEETRDTRPWRMRAIGPDSREGDEEGGGRRVSRSSGSCCSCLRRQQARSSIVKSVVEEDEDEEWVEGRESASLVGNRDAETTAHVNVR